MVGWIANLRGGSGGVYRGEWAATGESGGRFLNLNWGLAPAWFAREGGGKREGGEDWEARRATEEVV
jgi:hypothetical protein